MIGTLLNIQGKTKDGVNARLDLLEMNIRKDLTPMEVGRHTYLPPACYTMSRKENISFCLWLNSVKVPQGYSSNIKSLVSMQDFKLVGLKSHDCHVLIQQLLSVAIHGSLPKIVRSLGMDPQTHLIVLWILSLHVIYVHNQIVFSM